MENSKKAGKVSGVQAENFITLAVFLVLLQTLSEDILVFFQVSWFPRRFLMYTGLFFDLFFTIEFLVRAWVSLSRREFLKYFLRRNGWVDFLASVPLLVLSSGPALFSVISGYVFGGQNSLLGILKIVKVVRMARLLRLLRLLKIFGRIRFTGSVMVQRHTVRLTTTLATTIILSVTAMGLLFSVIDYPGMEEVMTKHRLALLKFVQSSQDADPDMGWELVSPALIKVKRGTNVLWTRYDDAYLKDYFSPADYSMEKWGEISMWFDLRPYSTEEARLNLTVFFLTLLAVCVLIVTYTTHFAFTVTDPVNIMLRGFSRPGYNLEVQIPSEYSGDDIFRLASLYNDEYLPLKAREQMSSGSVNPDILIDDIDYLIR